MQVYILSFGEAELYFENRGRQNGLHIILGEVVPRLLDGILEEFLDFKKILCKYV